jgi:16S rRNA (cytosine967-C5)-methyltransferase
MKLSLARTAAYDVLLKIETQHAYSSTLLANFETKLEPTDRGLCHEIVLGVLRRKLLLDRYIDLFARSRKLDIEVRLILQIGLFQLYYLDRVPDHAVVNECVGLVARARKSSARGLVNAILRSAARKRPQIEYKNDIERISVETSHPEWLIMHWKDQLRVGSVEDLARSNNDAPAIAFRRTLKGSQIELPDDIRESPVVPGCFIAGSFNRKLRDLAERSEIYFQDEASQMVAKAIRLEPGDRFLDVCAAPGGKTTQVAYELSKSENVRSSLLVAGDLTQRRIHLLRETCGKQDAEFIQIVRYDAANSLPFEDGVFDRVFVDAPCTGTGTIKHNPEIRYRLENDDLMRMQKVQIDILFNASKLVKPGGSLVYSTCSLEREENEVVCSAFLSKPFDWLSIQPEVPQQFITDERFARTYPHRDGLDGFFLATFKRQ